MIRSLACGVVAFTISTGVAGAQNIFAEIYGGVALEDRTGLTYDGVVFPMDQGRTFGIGVYSTRWLGAELGVDIMATDRRYTGFRTGVQSTSLMLAARYPFALGRDVEAYVGAGIGAIDVRYDGADQFPSFTGSNTVAGGQVSLGVRYQIDPTVGVFTELKHQRAFNDATISAAGSSIPQSYTATVGVVGLRFSF